MSFINHHQRYRLISYPRAFVSSYHPLCPTSNSTHLFANGDSGTEFVIIIFMVSGNLFGHSLTTKCENVLYREILERFWILKFINTFLDYYTNTRLRNLCSANVSTLSLSLEQKYFLTHFYCLTHSTNIVLQTFLLHELKKRVRQRVFWCSHSQHFSDIAFFEVVSILERVKPLLCCSRRLRNDWNSFHLLPNPQMPVLYSA